MIKGRFLPVAAAVLLLGLAALTRGAPASAETAALRLPVIEAPVGDSIIYGQSLSESVLRDGTAADPETGMPVEGYFAWANGDFVPGLGLQMCLCEFIPTGFDAEIYLPVSFRAPVEVRRIPCLVAEAPVCRRHIQYGEEADRAGLAGGRCVDPAGEEISGAWVFREGNRRPPAGAFDAEAVFVPEDSFHYEQAVCVVEAVCDPFTPGVAVTCTRASLGQPLSACVLEGWAAGLDGALIPGVFAFREGSLIPGDTGLYDVTFMPADSANYLPVTVKVPVVFGLKTAHVEAVLEIGKGQRIGQGILTWRAWDDDGQAVAGTLLPDERFTGMTAEDGESIGAVFIPRDTASYGQVPVSVRVIVR